MKLINKIKASTLLEMIVALTIMLIILTITFGIFMNIYKNALTLPKIKSVFVIKETIVTTSIEKSYINKRTTSDGLDVNIVVKDYSIAKLVQVSTSVKDSVKGIDYQFIILGVKD